MAMLIRAESIGLDEEPLEMEPIRTQRSIAHDMEPVKTQWDGPPKLRELCLVMRNEAKGVSTKWYDLGLELLEDRNHHELDVIKNAYQYDDNNCCREMFKKWLDTKPDSKWDDLVTALTNINMNTAAVHIKQLFQREDADPTTSPLSIGSKIVTVDRCSVEFGYILYKFIEELKKNEMGNLSALKAILCSMTANGDSRSTYFNSTERRIIKSITSIDELLTSDLLNNKHYRWDDHDLLFNIMTQFKAKKSLKLLKRFNKKVESKIMLHQVVEFYKNKVQKEPPEGYHKIIAIVEKDFRNFTKKQYRKVKQFTSQCCGVEDFALLPFSSAAPHSLALEWFIPTSITLYMIGNAKNNVNSFITQTFIYFKISSSVILDERNVLGLEKNELLKAADNGDLDTVNRLLDIQYIDVNIPGRWKKTALHRAAGSGQVDVVETLIKSGADLHAVDEWKMTALHCAVIAGRVQVIEVLIISGADVKALDEVKRTPIQLARLLGQNDAAQYLALGEKPEVKKMDQVMSSEENTQALTTLLHQPFSSDLSSAESLSSTSSTTRKGHQTSYKKNTAVERSASKKKEYKLFKNTAV